MQTRFQDALKGALVADAIAMPVHWYYNRDELDRDYPVLDPYAAPRNPHPGSILWRSKYMARNEKGEILHDQARFWGERGIHYHQFLEAGENTLNFQLGIELYGWVVGQGGYSEEGWLDRYISCMQTPAWHQDTYCEGYHRAFFDNLARGKAPRKCGIADFHIGGLATVPFLVAALDVISEPEVESWVQTVRRHIGLTHNDRRTLDAAEALTRMLIDLANGVSLQESIRTQATAWVSPEGLRSWSELSDRTVIGKRLSSACYLPESFTASLFLAWKYDEDFTAGILANARCGGDNCHRGTVVGALLGAVGGVPERFLKDLVSSKRLDFAKVAARFSDEG